MRSGVVNTGTARARPGQPHGLLRVNRAGSCASVPQAASDCAWPSSLAFDAGYAVTRQNAPSPLSGKGESRRR